MITSQKK